MDYYATDFQVGDDGLNFIFKGPSETLTFTLDYTDGLDTETITASAWSIPTGLTDAGSNFTSKLASVKIGGGTVGQAYLVSNSVVSSTSQILVRKFKLVIVER